MKKIVKTLLAVALVCNVAFAQDNTDGAKGKRQHLREKMQANKKRAEAAMVKVGLTNEQQAKSTEVFKATAQKVREIKKSGLSKDEAKSKLKDIRTDNNKQLETIMGKEKHNAWKKEMKATKPQHEGKGKHKVKDDEDEMRK
jgi:hypothetical protein